MSIFGIGRVYGGGDIRNSSSVRQFQPLPSRKLDEYGGCSQDNKLRAALTKQNLKPKNVTRIINVLKAEFKRQNKRDPMSLEELLDFCKTLAPIDINGLSGLGENIKPLILPALSELGVEIEPQNNHKTIDGFLEYLGFNKQYFQEVAQSLGEKENEGVSVFNSLRKYLDRQKVHQQSTNKEFLDLLLSFQNPETAFWELSETGPRRAKILSTAIQFKLHLINQARQS